MPTSLPRLLGSTRMPSKKGKGKNDKKGGGEDADAKDRWGSTPEESARNASATRKGSSGAPPSPPQLGVPGDENAPKWQARTSSAKPTESDRDLEAVIQLLAEKSVPPFSI